MPTWMQIDWEKLLIPSRPILDIVVRGTCMYVALFFLLRAFRRQTGSLGRADLLVLLLIADAAQNGMASNYESVTEGLILVATIVAWEYTFDWLAYHLPAMSRLIERQPLPLIEEGQVREANLAQEMITRDELLSQLRQNGIADVSQVKQSFVEGDGHISVIVASPAASSDIRANST